ncbi:MAG: hypothetical protein FWD38_09195 [Oscillospiraceae bacterium]|nr:hypothetical protein [Oscillospiraceae bacterium]
MKLKLTAVTVLLLINTLLMHTGLTATANEPRTIIEVDISVIMPTVTDGLSWDATNAGINARNGNDYYTINVQWEVYRHEVYNWQNITESMTLQAGDQIWFYIQLIAKPGYVFGTSTVFKVNGEVIESFGSGEEVEHDVFYELTADMSQGNHPVTPPIFEDDTEPAEYNFEEIITAIEETSSLLETQNAIMILLGALILGSIIGHAMIMKWKIL